MTDSTKGGKGGTTTGFDRIKPPEQRLMQRPAGPRLDDAEAEADGRAALFTSGSGQAAERSRQRARQEPAGRAKRSPTSGDAGHASQVGGETSEPRSGLLGLTAHCSRCDATSPVDATTALRAVLPLALVAPWKRHQLFAVCPACGHRAWLRVSTS